MTAPLIPTIEDFMLVDVFRADEIARLEEVLKFSPDPDIRADASARYIELTGPNYESIQIRMGLPIMKGSE